MRQPGIKNTELEVITSQNGYRFATSIDGGLMGRGGDFFIIDDPLKPSDALNDVRRSARAHRLATRASSDSPSKTGAMQAANTPTGKHTQIQPPHLPPPAAAGVRMLVVSF